MAALLMLALYFQLRTKAYSPRIYWLTVVLVSIVGTQITDVMTDMLDISLYTSTALFAVLLTINFLVWYKVERNLSIREIVTPRRELFYWTTVLCTFALGTAAGDLATEALGLGFHPWCFYFRCAYCRHSGGLAFGWQRGADLLAGLHPDPSFWRLSRRLAYSS